MIVSLLGPVLGVGININPFIHSFVHPSSEQLLSAPHQQEAHHEAG